MGTAGGSEGRDPPPPGFVLQFGPAAWGRGRRRGISTADSARRQRHHGQRHHRHRGHHHGHRCHYGHHCHCRGTTATMATNTNSHHDQLPPRAPLPQPLQTSLSPLPPLPPLPLWPPWPPLPPVSPHRPTTRGTGGPASSPCDSPRPGRCQTAAGGAGRLQGPGQTQPGAVSQDALTSPWLLASLGREKQARVRRGIKARDDRDQERALLLPSLLPQFPLQENTPEIQVCVTEKQGGGGNHGEVRRDPTATVTVPRSELKTGRA